MNEIIGINESEIILQQILNRLTAIESKVDFMANPSAQVSAEEKGMILRKAIATGDRKKVRAAVKQINGG